jgi:sulfur-oxidizing protein SoxX
MANFLEGFAMKMNHRLCMLLSGLVLAGCSSAYEGFTLPTGDTARGKEAFVHFRCYDCHSVSGEEMPAGEERDQAVVELGGEVARVRTYDDLVTAIINPSHRLAQGYAEELVARDGTSKMTIYNDVMTVSQLVDLVTFLQGKYQLRTPMPTTYPQYYGP